MTETVDVYFDFRSPYAYFAECLIARGDARLPPGVAWRWRPVSINVLLNLQAGRAPTSAYVDPLAPPKRRYVFTDVDHCSDYYAIPYQLPEPLRPDTLPAMALFASLDADPVAQALILPAVFDGVWRARKNVGDRAILTEIATAASISPSAVDHAFSPAAREELVARSVRTYETAGVFGVPTFAWNGELFFGVDHLPMVCAAAVRVRRAA